MVGLNAHERPPEPLRQLYKRLRSIKPSEIDSSPLVLNLQQLDDKRLPDGLRLKRILHPESVSVAFDRFIGSRSWRQASALEGVSIYTHEAVPGLQIIPSLIPPVVQIELLSRILHRDLCDERHQTNVHLHYNVSYPAADADATSAQQSPSSNLSFFQDEVDRLLTPKDPSVHAPVSIKTMLNTKLRWMTLGGQYNWTDKVYPKETPPDFPKDVATLLHDIFPDTTAEAAIVNLYSPGDTLSLHRDVSEECDAPLVSISFGCDGIFMIGNEDESSCAVIRLRSGDAVYMAGSSRFSWHAVPKILPATCPPGLQHWPGTTKETDHNPYSQWQNWMAGKRINLNVRQMKSKTGSDL